MEGRVYIGTSGYSYKSWAKTFYGATPKRLHLEHYVTVFPTVEINATFYKLPTLPMVHGWRDRVGEPFVYAMKGSRFITHMKKLANLGGGLRRYFWRLSPMEERIAVVLWQLPPMLGRDVPRLEKFVKRLPKRLRHAVEFRHPSWYAEEVFDVLRRHGAAHVALSSKGMPMNLAVTTDIIYVRFHGLEGGAAHDYTRGELEPWAEYLREQAEAGRSAYVYFNNDVNVRAPENAQMLMEMVREFAVLPGSARMVELNARGAEMPRSRRIRKVAAEKTTR